MNEHHPDLTDVWLLPVAAETWDGYLNEINGHHVTEDTVARAIERASGGPIDEGSVGGGTGMNCYQFKGGSGTSSRTVDYAGTVYTVGVFVQANFGRRDELVITGVPLGTELADDNPMADFRTAPPGSGSVIALVATDAPLLPNQCAAMARRVTSGLARTGTAGSHFSGDLFLAFSTGNPGAFSAHELTAYTGEASDATGASGARAYDHLRFIPWGQMDPFFTAVVQGCEEAVINALVANADMTGRNGHRTPALPRDRVAEIVRRRAGTGA
jgi:D-aminopeptidase